MNKHDLDYEIRQAKQKLDYLNRLNSEIGKFVVKFKWDAFTTCGKWVPVMCQGFITEDCTRAEIEAYVKDFVSTRNDGINSRISHPIIQEITDEQAKAWDNADSTFWSKQIEKMTRWAAERMQRDNC
jgi:hypothetical protein